MKKYISFLLLLCFTFAFTQEKPAFWSDIQSLNSKKTTENLPSDAILLLGSSSFTMWQDVGDYFPTKKFINFGFGGSRLVDVNFYIKELLEVPTPKQILVYCGENDIAYDVEPAKAEQVRERFETLYNTLRTRYPEAQIDYLSMKHSPSRESLWPEMEKGNALIKQFVESKENSSYIEINPSIEDKDGNPRTELFLKDLLHLNPKGYQNWAKVIAPYLK
ncbi:GDSL-type esterase/lipase family protein [Chryseobacterium sp. A301]